MTTLTSTDVPLSEAVRRATEEAHGNAETAPFVTSLMAGELPIEGYARLVAQHRAIYEALEEPIDRLAEDAEIAGFLDEHLWRLAALERDLVALLGDGWQDRHEAQLVPITGEYCERIRQVSATWPGGWLAHAYTRYLGDLSGGLFIRRRLEETYGIDATSGTAFYDFPGIPSAKAWKDAFRARLDALPWGAEERERFTAEVLESYRCNTVLFEQLGG